MNDVVSVCAPCFDPANSYGLLACRLAEHLAGRGVYVNAIAPVGVRERGQSKAMRRIAAQPIRPALGGVLMAYPTNFHRFGALANLGPRVAVTMFESTALPRGWADALNACAATVVPSPWLVEVFHEAGVRTPIHVIPLGVSRTYRYTPRTDGGPFTFLAFIDINCRKGWDLAAFAFEQAFGKNTDYRLILKARKGERLRISNPNIEVLSADLSERQMQALYTRCHCLLWPSRGEGFALPPREFAASGGLVLATGWSGNADDLSEWGEALPYRMVPAWPGHKAYKGLGQWAEPDPDALIAAMRRAAEIPLDERNRLGATRSARVRALYDWRRFGDAVWDVWRTALDILNERRGLHGDGHGSRAAAR